MITDGWGVWYLVEVIGFVLIPCCMFAYGVRNRRVNVVRLAAVLTLVGILLNRLNVSVIAFNWNAAAGVFRWIVHRMPVLRQSPRAGPTTVTGGVRWKPTRT